MSSRATHWALQQMTELPVDKLILIALADFADENHQCFPSRKKLAIIGMCSVDTVDRALGRLIAAGYVDKEVRVAERGGLTSNCYTLQVEAQSDPSRKMRPPLAAPCGHPQPQIAATLAAPDAATLAAQDAATKGTITLTTTITNSPSSKGPKKPKQPKGSRLDPNWQLPDEWRSWARTSFPASTDEAVNDQAERFRDYWIAQPGARANKLDWAATWRNWCRHGLSALGTVRKPQHTGRYHDPDSSAAMNARALAKIKAELGVA